MIIGAVLVPLIGASPTIVLCLASLALSIAVYETGRLRVLAGVASAVPLIVTSLIATEALYAGALVSFSPKDLTFAIAGSLVGVLISLSDQDKIAPRLWREAGPAGLLLRRVLPAIVLTPALIGYAHVRAQDAGFIGSAFGSAAMVVVTVVLLAGMVIPLARTMSLKEAELRRSVAFVDAVLENLPNMVFVKEAEGLRFARINRAGEELLGVKRQDLLGKSDDDFFPAEQARFFVDKDRETLRQGKLVRVDEEKIQTAQGERWLSTQKVPILDEHGTPIFLLGISEDITERKSVGDELRRAKDLAETTSKELEAFSYSVSHDLRAPLRGIDGFSQALLEDCGDQLDEMGKMYLTRVRAAAQRMAQLIDDLLELSKVTRTELRRQRVDLSTIAGSVGAELRAHAPERDVTIEIEPDLSGDGDPRLLRVVLANLLGNAFKFTAKKPGARIQVGARLVDGERQFFVKDDGAGFDMAFANKLFGAFQRLHPASDFEGTGIGLATVKRIIGRHGGRVWAEGEVGKGATFFFTISGSPP